MELELTARLVEDLDTGHVGGKKIGGELDSSECSVDRFCQRTCERGLAHAGHVFDEQMSLSEHAQERESYLTGLSVDHALDIGDELLEAVCICPDLELKVFDIGNC